MKKFKCSLKSISKKNPTIIKLKETYNWKYCLGYWLISVNFIKSKWNVKENKHNFCSDENSHIYGENLQNLQADFLGLQMSEEL